MRITARHPIAALAGLAVLAACGTEESGPVSVAAIGGPARLANPNRVRLDPPSAFLALATAQGLVRFDAAGEIEPALAQRWIVSDDGLRYTFRLAGAQWRSGGRVTAEQVAARLRAALSPASRNPMKPILGAVDEIVAMTDEVLEISLKSPRPNFLQLLAQPELTVLRNGEGSGPYRASAGEDEALSLSLPRTDEEEDAAPADPPLRLRGSAAQMAVAAFTVGGADLVLGGTLADLPVARAARANGNSLVFDPVAGLFGFSFAAADGPLAQPEVRHALAMAIDRAALVAALRVPGLQPRETLLPPGVEGLAAPAAAAWSTLPLAERRALASRTLAAHRETGPLRIRVALSAAPGHRLLFAHLARDWAAVGVLAERVAANAAAADLRFIDDVAPIGLASWYLRHFACDASRVCDPAADEAMAAARIAPDAPGRRAMLANADRLLADAAPFIALAAPVRWSLVSPRLNGFRPNPFAHHAAGELIRPDP